MARLRDPYGMALEGLRAGLRAGRFGLGAPLVAAELAPTLSVSATPLREALSRLAGEGLLEDRRVGRHADDAFGVYQLLQVAGLQTLPRQVIQPDGYAFGG